MQIFVLKLKFYRLKFKFFFLYLLIIDTISNFFKFFQNYDHLKMRNAKRVIIKEQLKLKLKRDRPYLVSIIYFKTHLNLHYFL